MQLLREMEVEFMVAPFEADAQLAHLSRTRYVDGVMSEDGDLLVLFRCRILLRDLDSKAETVKEIGWVQIREGLEHTVFKEFDGEDCYQKMVEACILAGCDYLTSMEGVGLKTACKELKLHVSVEKVSR